MITASELKEKRTIHEQRKRWLYEKEVERCFALIKNAHVNRPEVQYTFISVPMTIPGEPFYNFNECFTLVKIRLRDSGFYRRVLKPGNTLFISWDEKLTRNITEKKPTIPRDDDILYIDYDPSDRDFERKIVDKIRKMKR